MYATDHNLPCGGQSAGCPLSKPEHRTWRRAAVCRLPPRGPPVGTRSNCKTYKSRLRLSRFKRFGCRISGRVGCSVHAHRADLHGRQRAGISSGHGAFACTTSRRAAEGAAWTRPPASPDCWNPPYRSSWRRWGASPVSWIGRADPSSRETRVVGSTPRPQPRASTLCTRKRRGRSNSGAPAAVKVCAMRMHRASHPAGDPATETLESRQSQSAFVGFAVRSRPHRRPSERHRRTAGNAEAYAAGFDKGDLPMPPGAKVAVVACMDARLNPYGMLGLKEGDAHVIRNAGGVITDDEIRSLAISQRLLGTEEIILIHHTDCGMVTFSDDQFRTSSRPTPASGRRGRPRRSPTSTRTCASRSAGSRPARSSRGRTPCAASSTRSRRAACAR